MQVEKQQLLKQEQTNTKSLEYFLQTVFNLLTLFFDKQEGMWLVKIPTVATLQ